MVPAFKFGNGLEQFNQKEQTPVHLELKYWGFQEKVW